MKKAFFLLVMLLLTIFLESCEFKKPYKYIEIIRYEGALRNKGVEEKDPKTIRAISDSAAYVEAYRSYCISLAVNSYLISRGKEIYYTQMGFKLINNEGNDISSTVYFENKEAIEEEIMDKMYRIIMESDKSANSLPNSFSYKYLPGLAPVDVYLNMEKYGFETEIHLSEKSGNFWISTKNVPGIDYRVETYSSNIDNVESVKATATIDMYHKNISTTQQFFILITSLPYHGADPQRAGNWIRDNFYNDKATIVIGDARFKIFAPTNAFRKVIIEKNK